MKFVKKKMHEVMVQAAIWLQPECGVSRCIKISLQLLTILGHDVRVTQVVSHNLRPCAPEHIGWAVQKLRKMPLIAGVGQVRISAKSGAKHSWTNWIPGVNVRHLQPTRLSFVYRG
jgi:hypothetical protein